MVTSRSPHGRARHEGRGTFQLQVAIAVVCAESSSYAATDWAQVVAATTRCVNTTSRRTSPHRDL
jgi:predicted RNA polymerase sigma factor